MFSKIFIDGQYKRRIKCSQCFLFSIQQLGDAKPGGDPHSARHLEGQHWFEVVAA